MKKLGLWALIGLVIGVSGKASGLNKGELSRDPRQLTIIVSDLDESLFHNVGNFRVRLSPNAGVMGLGLFNGLPQIVRVPVHDFEGNTGPKIKDLLGKMPDSGFIPSSALGEVTLSNGEKIYPGYYYLDPVDGYAEFRPDLDAKDEDGHLVRAIEEKFKSNSAFLLEGAAFLAATFDHKYADHIAGMVLTMRGHTSSETSAALNKLGSYFGWGKKNIPGEAMINLTHPEFYSYGTSKDRAIDEIYRSLTKRNMRDFSTPHYLVMVENDRRYLESLDIKMRNFAARGVYANPVVPILVNLVEPEVFGSQSGVDWDRSRLESVKSMSRVQIYHGSNYVEKSNNLSRVFELILGQSASSARDTYNSYVGSFSKFLCPNLMLSSPAFRKSGGRQ